MVSTVGSHLTDSDFVQLGCGLNTRILKISQMFLCVAKVQNQCYRGEKGTTMALDSAETIWEIPCTGQYPASV